MSLFIFFSICEIYCTLSCGEPAAQPGGDEGGDGDGTQDADAAAERLEQLDDNQLAVEHLGQRRLIGDIEQNGGQRAADVSQNQRVGHGAHDVPADGEAGLHQMPERDVRHLLLNLEQGGGDVHRDVHGGAHRADDDGGKDDRL